MNWVEVSVTVTPEAVEAVTHILMEAGAGGVVELAPAVRVAYFPDDQAMAHRLEEIQAAVANLASFGLDPGPASVTWQSVAESQWADAWKDHFHPVRISDRLIIRPTWREYNARPGEIVLDLDPGMAFGTGAHPTTMMCARGLESLVKPGDRVMDVGTGSGILAIAAARLGASEVWACDTDPVAVRVARENIALNGVADVVNVIEGSWPELLQRAKPVQVVVANIIASVIEEMIPDAPRLLTADGRLLVSGIASFRRAGVVTTFSRHGWDVVNVQSEGDWVSIEARLSGMGD